MIDDVNHEAEEPFDEIFPAPRSSLQAAVQQNAVVLGKTHAFVILVERLKNRGFVESAVWTFVYRLPTAVLL